MLSSPKSPGLISLAPSLLAPLVTWPPRLSHVASPSPYSDLSVLDQDLPQQSWLHLFNWMSSVETLFPNKGPAQVLGPGPH